MVEGVVERERRWRLRRIKLGCECAMRRLNGETWRQITERTGERHFSCCVTAVRVWRKSLGPVRRYGPTDGDHWRPEDHGYAPLPLYRSLLGEV